MFARTFLIVTGLTGLMAAPAESQPATSTYTSLDLARCRTLEVIPEGASVRRRCPGLGAIPLFINEGDDRVDIDAGIDNRVWESLSPFNVAGDRIEWRLHAGRPFAIIYRLRVTDPSRPPASSLIVETIGRPGAPGCQVATVDGALADANSRARVIADALGSGAHCPGR